MNSGKITEYHSTPPAPGGLDDQNVEAYAKTLRYGPLVLQQMRDERDDRSRREGRSK